MNPTYNTALTVDDDLVNQSTSAAGLRDQVDD
jgi:hypothetical protein